MKILHKTTRDYMIASVSILVITGISLFLILRKEIGDEMNEQLELQADELFANTRPGRLVDTPFLKIRMVSANTLPGQIFGDSMIYDRIQRKVEEYHYLIETKDITGRRFQAVVMTSHIGWDRYYLTIFYIFVLTALLLTGSGILINYISSKNIWNPFFDNLKTVQQFSVTSTSELRLLDSSIHEFKELNMAFKDLTERSRKEYRALREFTENASHEIQTPLSIIQSTLDRMSQMDINEEMANYIVQAKSGIDRLSKTNRSLLLLAKLDNAVFNDFQQVFVNELLNAQLRNMEELFSNRKIEVTENIELTTVFTDPYLVETLLTNLLSNALRYTPSHGRVEVTLRNDNLTMSNTGREPGFSKEKIFERFIKSGSNTTSTGLGLAIAREICRLNKWGISYHYSDGKNHFEVKFR